MEENRLWFLLARHFSGELSDAESGELQDFLALHPDKQYLVNMLESYFHSPTGTRKQEEEGNSRFEERFKSIIDRGELSKDMAESDESIRAKTFVLTKFWRVAAVISFIILVSCLTYYFFHQQKPPKKILSGKSNEIFSRSGVRTKLTLPDGTQVWLNSGSRLIYSNDFNGKAREVELEGEGFFDVTKDTEHPFIVHASNLNIIVVGTAFNVKSYPRDETIETTLLRGIIEVSRKDNPSAPKVILKPNQKLIFNKEPEKETRQNANISGTKVPLRSISVTTVLKNIPDSNKVETAWVYNRLVFDGDNFQELAAKMERWYNVKISFADKEIMQYRFKGAFAGESISEALNALQLTANFRYQLTSDEITLFKK
jgi:ferric-dicitrate binding protein FerR (iron transport regulator)